MSRQVEKPDNGLEITNFWHSTGVQVHQFQWSIENRRVRQARNPNNEAVRIRYIIRIESLFCLTFEENQIPRINSKFKKIKPANNLHNVFVFFRKKKKKRHRPRRAARQAPVQPPRLNNRDAPACSIRTTLGCNCTTCITITTTPGLRVHRRRTERPSTRSPHFRPALRVRQPAASAPCPALRTPRCTRRTGDVAAGDTICNISLHFRFRLRNLEMRCRFSGTRMRGFLNTFVMIFFFFLIRLINVAFVRSRKCHSEFIVVIQRDTRG